MVVALLVVHAAAANPIYPGVIHEALGLPSGELYPLCTLCHATLDGGFGTVNKPFGKECMARGLDAKNGQDALPGILDDMESEDPPSDVDGDGVGDVEELRDGTDPNVPGNTLSPPQYGCLSTTSGTAPAALLTLVGLGLVLRRRR